MRDYIRINQLEGEGCSRIEARFYADLEKADRADRERWRRRSSASSMGRAKIKSS